jgi:hypothetical protein
MKPLGSLGVHGTIILKLVEKKNRTRRGGTGNV